MHIENLKIFRDLVDNESFSKAAKLNAITQSAVGVERARVGLAGMGFKCAGPAWVGIQRVLMLQHVVQGSLCPFYLTVF